MRVARVRKAGRIVAAPRVAGACASRVCPACEGDGRIDRTTRDGMSVFPSFEGLCRYIAERDADTAGFIAIELEGDLTGDVDLDADAGALLIRPTRVVGALPFEHAMTAWSRVGATRRVPAS